MGSGDRTWGKRPSHRSDPPGLGREGLCFSAAARPGEECYGTAMASRPGGFDSAGTGGSQPIPDTHARLLAMLAYALGAFSGVILLVSNREDRFVQFHALQSIALTGVGIWVLAVLWLFSFFPLLGFLYGMLLRLLQVFLFLYWLYLIWQAHRGRWYRVPTIGAWADRQLV